jgi:hypothetical protein
VLVSVISFWRIVERVAEGGRLNPPGVTLPAVVSGAAGQDGVGRVWRGDAGLDGMIFAMEEIGFRAGGVDPWGRRPWATLVPRCSRPRSPASIARPKSPASVCPVRRRLGPVRRRLAGLSTLGPLAFSQNDACFRDIRVGSVSVRIREVQNEQLLRRNIP